MKDHMTAAKRCYYGGLIGLAALAMALIGCVIIAASAQDANERTRAAAPFLAQQLHDAVDNLALCQGDQALLKQQLADAKAELEKLKAAPPK